MSLQHHFVVVVEDGKLWIDQDTTDHKFYEGSVWNTKIEDWEANYEHAHESERAMELLWDRLNFGYDQLVGNVLDTISEMKSTGDYHNDTLEEIEWKLTMPKGEDRILPYKKEKA
jgi:L-rhamnose isomerase